MMNDKKAFTLAESLIVLTILGVIAAITVPSVVKRHMEAIDRTKLKKAMSIYDYSIQKMTVENDIKSDKALENWSKEKENCGNTTVYFKKSSGDGCEFKTADNVYWYIKDIMNPVVALSKDAMDKYKSTGETDGSKSFKFVTSYDSKTGAFRSNDLKYEEQLALETGDEEALEELEKVWCVVDSKSVTCDSICQYKKGTYSKPCDGTLKACTELHSECGFEGGEYYGCITIYDENGFDVVSKSRCDTNGNNCKESSYTSYSFNSDMSYSDFNKAFNNGETPITPGTTLKGRIYSKCDENFKNCQSYRDVSYKQISETENEFEFNNCEYDSEIGKYDCHKRYKGSYEDFMKGFD